MVLYTFWQCGAEVLEPFIISWRCYLG